MKTVAAIARPFALIAITSSLTSLVACSASPEGVENVGSDALAYDTVKNPTLHGELSLGEPSDVELTSDERYHAFDFGVPVRAAVRITTLPALINGAVVDTTLVLYKQGPNGFGSAVTSGEDAHKTVWSEVSRTLEPGAYRVIVKGKTAAVRGVFRVAFECPQCLETSACVFGTTYSRVREGLTVDVARARLVNDVAQLSALERLQLVEALHASSHTDVTTAEEALAAADQNEVNILELWDRTNARAFTAFEYGAGDNSYGRIFAAGSTTTATSIHDGDLIDCNVLPGNGGHGCRAANAATTCGAGFTCAGISRVTGMGSCAPAGVSPEGIGNDCTAEPAGACNAGLVCGGLTRGDIGMCQASWMRGTFSDWYGVTVPDNTPAGVTRTIDVHGLATVDVDVSLEAIVRHANAAQLRVTLTNPAGTEVTVYDGTSRGADLRLTGKVHGFSGDESVNGTWTLKVVDTKRGTVGTLERWALNVTSRLD